MSVAGRRGHPAPAGKADPGGRLSAKPARKPARDPAAAPAASRPPRITFLHLTLGEQAPKIGAIQRARATTLWVVYPLRWFYLVFRPFISLINVSSNWMLRVAGFEPVSEHDQAITEEEVRMILTQSAAMGHITARETTIMQNVLDLELKMARRSMVPRNQIVFLDKKDPMERKLEVASRSGHTRLPLCDGDLDHVIGVVHIKDVFASTNLRGELATMVQVAREALFVPETIRLDALLREFQRARSHLALLVDEYGGVSGMITLENVIEEVLGPIQDEFDSELPPVRKTGAQRFEVDAACPVDEFVRECGVRIPADLDVDSVGGVVTASLGHIPRAGETLELDQHRITVLAASPTHVSRVLVEKSSQARSPEGPGQA